MTQLRESLVLSDARAISLLRQVTKDGWTYVLQIRGPLTPDLADTLQCRNQTYKANNDLYPSLKSLSLDHQISTCELSVLNLSPLQPTVVTGFTIKPSEAADAEHTLELHFRLKFTRGLKELNALLSAVRDNPFDLTLQSLQGGLFDVATTSNGAAAEDEPEGEEGEEGDETPKRRRRK